jgi:hypothetical protein
MANDRVMLRCKVCGDRFPLLSYLPLRLSFVFDELGAWLTKHCEECHGDVLTLDLDCDPRFVTETE